MFLVFCCFQGGESWNNWNTKMARGQEAVDGHVGS